MNDSMRQSMNSNSPRFKSIYKAEEPNLPPQKEPRQVLVPQSTTDTMAVNSTNDVSMVNNSVNRLHLSNVII